ncbi:MAG: hypothetical protein LLG01_08435 [Planctomycetaceae bacterium]|nr:hypothetical protein [Planctomycetaceae bacterium]
MFPFIWSGAVLAVYLVHFLYCLSSGQDVELRLFYCALTASIPFGTAIGCGILVWWLARQPISGLRKACFMVLSIAVAIPIILTSGFVWLLTHMAP